MIKNFCDRCNKEIDINKAEWLQSKRSRLEFCDSCYDDVWRSIEFFMQQYQPKRWFQWKTKMQPIPMAQDLPPEKPKIQKKILRL